MRCILESKGNIVGGRLNSHQHPPPPSQALQMGSYDFHGARVYGGLLWMSLSLSSLILLITVIFIHHKPRIAVAIVVDEDDLKWVAYKKTYVSLLLKQLDENFSSKTPMCRELNHSSEMQNDALMHRWGFKELSGGVDA